MAPRKSATSVNKGNSKILDHKNDLKNNIIEQLTMMREEIQPLLYDSVPPQRVEFVQRANFLYALIFKIKEEFKSASSVLDYIKTLEGKYPLAGQTIKEVKNMPYLQNKESG
jgi:hypothetical protein